MTRHHLRNDISIDILPYDHTHAQSISESLFNGVDVEVIIEQRKELLAPGPEEVYSVCSLDRELVIGVCTGVRKRWYGERHRIEMVQVVVKDDYQKMGIAKAMMRQITDHFRQYGVDIIQISAEAGNIGAVHAYERIGFKQIGILQNGLKYNDEYSDEVMLAMKISDMR